MTFSERGLEQFTYHSMKMAYLTLIYVVSSGVQPQQPNCIFEQLPKNPATMMMPEFRLMFELGRRSMKLYMNALFDHSYQSTQVEHDSHTASGTCIFYMLRNLINLISVLDAPSLRFL
jgi:hypothetical protein